ncbi:MAG TPA: Gfo/Idh/MocA family oxidoreductase [Polyangiales bacterium]|nr:Gfo/Idh/MocA family oxidoreductase [Polyangiales bacterium]
MTLRRRKGAIVGFGFIAESGHLPAYQSRDEFEIAAVADISPARREVAARALPRARIYADHESLLAHEAGELDFVDITAPPYAHTPVARDALSSGLHVLCEKPLATDVDDALGLFALAEHHKRVLFPSHNYRHAPVIKAVRETLDSGVIGKVHMVTLATFRNTHARGVKEWNENWRRQKRFSGGGIAMDHGSHTFYLAFEWLRSYPTSVVAKTTAAAEFDTEDNFQAMLTFPTGTATAQLSWTAGMRKVIYTIHGDHGALRVEDDDVETSVFHTNGNPNPAKPIWERSTQHVSSAWMDASHVAWFGSLFDSFAKAMDERSYLGSDAQDALRCIEVIRAAYASAGESSREQPLSAAH